MGDFEKDLTGKLYFVMVYFLPYLFFNKVENELHYSKMLFVSFIIMLFVSFIMFYKNYLKIKYPLTTLC